MILVKLRLVVRRFHMINVHEDKCCCVTHWVVGVQQIKGSRCCKTGGCINTAGASCIIVFTKKGCVKKQEFAC